MSISKQTYKLWVLYQFYFEVENWRKTYQNVNMEMKDAVQLVDSRVANDNYKRNLLFLQSSCVSSLPTFVVPCVDSHLPPTWFLHFAIQPCNLHYVLHRPRSHRHGLHYYLQPSTALCHVIHCHSFACPPWSSLEGIFTEVLHLYKILNVFTCLLTFASPLIISAMHDVVVCFP